jgi:hypothetical protein
MYERELSEHLRYADNNIRSLFSAKSCSVLGIEHCIKISDIAMADCVSHLPRLSFLSLDNCEYIGGSTVASLAHVIPTIVDLYLNCCPFITDQEIIIIAKACKNVS